MKRLLHRAALIFVIACQSLTSSPARVCVEHAELVSNLVQRVQRAVASAPRWAHTVDRVGSGAHPQRVPRSNDAS